MLPAAAASTQRCSSWRCARRHPQRCRAASGGDAAHGPDCCLWACACRLPATRLAAASHRQQRRRRRQQGEQRWAAAGSAAQPALWPPAATAGRAAAAQRRRARCGRRRRLRRRPPPLPPRQLHPAVGGGAAGGGLRCRARGFTGSHGSLRASPGGGPGAAQRSLLWAAAGHGGRRWRGLRAHRPGEQPGAAAGQPGAGCRPDCRVNWPSSAYTQWLCLQPWLP